MGDLLIPEGVTGREDSLDAGRELRIGSASATVDMRCPKREDGRAAAEEGCLNSPLTLGLPRALNVVLLGETTIPLLTDAARLIELLDECERGRPGRGGTGVVGGRCITLDTLARGVARGIADPVIMLSLRLFNR